TAGRAVIANVTPTQLYERLLEDEAPPALAERGRRFRYGRSEMQIHFALSEPPRWEGDDRLGQTAIVHLTPGLDGVSRAVNEAERGLLPAEATVVVGQPLTMDPSRAPEGSGLLALDQNLLWRPFAASPGHATAVKRLWHIGASTHPGPGLGAGSGALVAKRLLAPSLAGRVMKRLRV